MISEHRFGPELGYKPVTYTCMCGFRSTDHGVLTSHIMDERERAHMPRLLTTVKTGGSTGIEVASTPYGDQNEAVEFRMTVRDGRDGHYRQHMVLVHRSNLALLIEALEAHRLGSDLDPCAACAAQTFATRLTDVAMRLKHSCAKDAPLEPPFQDDPTGTKLT